MKTLLMAKIKKLQKEYGYISTSMFTELERRYMENQPANFAMKAWSRPCGK